MFTVVQTRILKRIKMKRKKKNVSSIRDRAESLPISFTVLSLVPRTVTGS